jgi:RimJ/RimL family protein N-acetyltransferase
MDAVLFDLQPTLTGDLVELRPLRANDWKDLFEVAADPLIWQQHPASDRYKEEVFRGFFQDALECGGAFVVIDRQSSRIIGSTRFYGFDPKKSEIEIGWTFLARQYWGGSYNRDMKRLLLNHALRFVETVVFYVGKNNIRSQKAMEKIGGIRDGVVERFSQGTVVKNVRFIIPRVEFLPGESG